LTSPSLNPHESIELKELLNQEVLGIKQLSSSLQIVKDMDLKSFMEDALADKKFSLNELVTTLETLVTSQ